MKFFDIVKHSNHLSEFSPNSQYLASALNDRIFIRDVKSMQLVRTFNCVDNIGIVKWSPDSEIVVCAMLRKRVVQIWHLMQPDWVGKIQEGVLNIVDVDISPDSRHILVTSELHLKVTIWSLADRSVYYMKFAKPISHGKAFSKNGKFLALAERRECQDHISIFSCATWQIIKHFKTKTSDMAGLMWSPDNSVLCVWESPVEYRFDIYSLDGQCLHSCTLIPSAYGISTLSWSLTGQVLAVGSFDQKVRLFNHITWGNIVEFDYPSKITSANVTIYKEKFPVQQSYADMSTSEDGSLSPYEVQENRPYIMAPLSSDSIKQSAKPGVGVRKLKFSPDCQFVASVSDHMPSVLWIWSMKNLEMAAILIHYAQIHFFDWHPDEAQIALCTGGTKVLIWSPFQTKSIDVPTTDGSFSIQKLKWCPSGSPLLALDQNEACICIV